MSSLPNKDVRIARKAYKKREKSRFEHLKHALNHLRYLEELITEKELALVTAQAEISAFENRYYLAVSKLLVELDQLEAQIAEILSKQKPKDAHLKDYAKERRQKADESSSHFAEREKEQPKNLEFKPSDDLKQLYRKVAKCLHPDLVTDDAERRRRTILMQEVNRAYAEGDESLLQLLLVENELGDETENTIERQLELINQKIEFVESRLESIDRKIDQLFRSSLYLLMIRVREASSAGVDLLSQMADDIERKIEIKRQLLHRLLKGNLAL